MRRSFTSVLFGGRRTQTLVRWVPPSRGLGRSSRDKGVVGTTGRVSTRRRHSPAALSLMILTQRCAASVKVDASVVRRRRQRPSVVQRSYWHACTAALDVIDAQLPWTPAFCEHFLSKYWQKAPVLIRGAVPGFAGLLDADELAGLALGEDVESRLILEKGGARPWELVRPRAARAAAASTLTCPPCDTT